MTALTTNRLKPVSFVHEHLDGLNTSNSDLTVRRYLSGRLETAEVTVAVIGRVEQRWAVLGSLTPE
jgi:hypothetical protein